MPHLQREDGNATLGRKAHAHRARRGWQRGSLHHLWKRFELCRMSLQSALLWQINTYYSNLTPAMVTHLTVLLRFLDGDIRARPREAARGHQRLLLPRLWQDLLGEGKPSEASHPARRDPQLHLRPLRQRLQGPGRPQGAQEETRGEEIRLRHVRAQVPLHLHLQESPHGMGSQVTFKIKEIGHGV